MRHEKPGWPSVVVMNELVKSRAFRKMSPSGVWCQILRLVMRSQNVWGRSSRRSGGLPAMIAELIAPIDTPQTQCGSILASCKA
jgi:hypothetical protein